MNAGTFAIPPGDAVQPFEEPRRRSEHVSGGLIEPPTSLRPIDPPARARLPMPLNTLVGRDAELQELLQLLLDPTSRLVTIRGAGGVGKTHLALETASRIEEGFDGAVWFVPLAAVVDPSLFEAEIARSLGLPELTDIALADQIAARLGRQRGLLVLDNMEHLVAVAPRVSRLLERCPTTTVLVTSREALLVRGELEVSLAPLHLPDDGATPREIAESTAVTLFVNRVASARPGFALTDENSASVASICRRLDGLPLAIELAAARARVLSLSALAERLEPRLPLLSGGMRDLPERQRTMRNAIDWSYALLEPSEQRLFRRLSLLPGGFRLDAAEAIADEPDDVPAFELVARLADKSLLTSVWHEGAAPRFRMLHTIHEFASDQLRASGEERQLWHRAATYWIARADASWSVSISYDGLRRELDGLEPEMDNLRAVLDWSERYDPATGIRLAGSLYWFWYLRGYIREGFLRLERLLDGAPADVDQAAMERAFLAAGALARHLRLRERLSHYLGSAQEIAAERNHRWGVGYAQFILAADAADHEEYDRAAELLPKAIVDLDAERDTGSSDTARILQAMVALNRDRHDEAAALLPDITKLPRSEWARSAGWTFHVIGLLAHARRDSVGAASAHRQALELFADVSTSGLAESFAGLASALAALGRPAEAARLFGASAAVEAEVGGGFHRFERSIFESAAASALRALGEETWSREHSIGFAMPRDSAVAEAIALPITQPAKPSRTDQLGLTVREVEVLRLIAEGLSDREVADRLGIGASTVSRHAANIYGKLGVNSRTAAANAAYQADLL